MGISRSGDRRPRVGDAPSRLKWDPEDYRRHSMPQLKSALELIRRMELRGNEHLLDIGCGDGKITAILSTLLPEGRVLGVDASEEMIEFASKRYPKDRYPNLSWRVVDATRLPFHGEFDVVFSNACQHWIADQRPVLSGIERSLRSGGKVYLRMRGRGELGRLEAILMELIMSARWREYFSRWSGGFGFHDPEDYRAWLSEAGLRPVRVELTRSYAAFRGREGLAGHIRTTWLPFTLRIPEEEREEFIYRMVDRYLEDCPPDAEGMVYIPSYRLEVEAYKPDRRRYTIRVRQDQRGGTEVLFKNYMEEVVDSTLEEILSRRDDVCKCDRCKLDIKALALNHLPPKYVVTDKGYVYTKVNELESQFKADVTVAVTNAMKVVRKNPRHDKD